MVVRGVYQRENGTTSVICLGKNQIKSHRADADPPIRCATRPFGNKTAETLPSLFTPLACRWVVLWVRRCFSGSTGFGTGSLAHFVPGTSKGPRMGSLMVRIFVFRADLVIV